MALWTNIGSYIGGLIWGDAKSNQLRTNIEFAQQALGVEHDVDLAIDGAAAGQATHAPVAGHGIVYDITAATLNVPNGDNIVTGLIGGRVAGNAASVDVTQGLLLNERTRYYPNGAATLQTWSALGGAAFAAQALDVWQVRLDSPGVYHFRTPLGLGTDDIHVSVAPPSAAAISLIAASDLNATDFEVRHYDISAVPPTLTSALFRIDVFLTKAM